MNYKHFISLIMILFMMTLSTGLIAQDETVAEKQSANDIFQILQKASQHLYKAKRIEKLEDKLSDLKAAGDLLLTIEDEALATQLNIAKFVIQDARKTIKLYQLLMQKYKKIDKERMKEIEKRIEDDIDKAMDDIDHYYQKRF